jgi:hypothetical protein
MWCAWLGALAEALLSLFMETGINLKCTDEKLKEKKKRNCKLGELGKECVEMTKRKSAREI